MKRKDKLVNQIGQKKISRLNLFKILYFCVLHKNEDITLGSSNL